MVRQFRIYFWGACILLLVLGIPIFGGAQSSANVSILREKLHARYDIVALQDGVGLVPHQNDGNIRLIEIRNGSIAINGTPLTAGEVRERVGNDADLIFAVTYLDATGQRELTHSESSAAAPASQANTQSSEEDNSAEAAATDRNGPARDDLVRIGSSIRVPKGERVDGDVVSIGGSADVDGEVTQDVSVIGGSLTLGPDAIVHGDVAVVGGSMNRAPGARVDGKVAEVGIGSGGAFPWNRPFRRNFRPRRETLPAAGLVGTILRTTLMILGGLLVVAMGGRFVGDVTERAAHEPLRSAFAGLVAEVCFVPLLVVTVIVLAISIIGIPLLILVPFGVAFAVVLMFVGFTGIAAHVGRWMSTRFGNHWGPYLSVAMGVLGIVAITLIARIIAVAAGFGSVLFVSGPLRVIGFLVEYVAWTMGIGAVILAWHSRRHPAPTSASPTSPGGAPISGIIASPIAGAPAGQ